MYTTVQIHDHERGLWFRRGEFQQVLPPGTYRLWHLPWNLNTTRIDAVDLREPRFEHPQLATLLEHPALREALTVVRLTGRERAVIYKDGEPLHALGPGVHAYWNDPEPVTVEMFDVAAPIDRHAPNRN